MIRSELECSLHHLANQIECHLADIFRELLIDGRAENAQSIAYSGCSFIASLREVRDGREGGDA